MNMTAKILVTGHKGYLGSVLTETLLRAKFRVSGVDTNYFFSRPLARRGLTEQIKDIREIAPADLRGVYAMVHLAAIADDASSHLVPAATAEINVAATLKLAALAKKAGVARFIFSSTCGIYGNTSEGEMNTETSPTLPNSPYTVSKLEAEKKLADLADSSFAPVFLRNATVFGWSPRNRFDSPVNNFAYSAATQGEIRLLSNGLAWRPVLHVNDVARAFLLALQAPTEKVWNGTFNVGADELNFRLVDIAKAAFAKKSAGSVKPTKGRQAASSYVCSFRKIKDELGFRPQWSLVQGMSDLVRKIKGSGNYQDIFHYNAETMSYLLHSGAIDSRCRWLNKILASSDT
jgi:nucleoside-diphosphate-sugar epimerase